MKNKMPTIVVDKSVPKEDCDSILNEIDKLFQSKIYEDVYYDYNNETYNKYKSIIDTNSKIAYNGFSKHLAEESMSNYLKSFSNNDGFIAMLDNPIDKPLTLVMENNFKAKKSDDGVFTLEREIVGREKELILASIRNNPDDWTIK